MTALKAESVAIVISEDVRVEWSGRYSFMGVYGPSLEVDRIPCVLPGLCATVLVKNPASPITDVRTEAVGPSGKTVLKYANDKLETPPAGPYMSIHSVRVFPILIDAEGDIRFTFRFNGDADLGVEGSVRVRLVPVE